MNKKVTGVFVGIVSATGVLLLVMAATERKAPGAVSVVHARLAEIDGGQSCSACHGGWFGDMKSACSECHADVAGQLETKKGLHGSLAPELAATCSTCHGEHHGEQFRLVNRLAFAQAGVPDPTRFDHELVGFAMRGVHNTLACTECHENADVELLPEGEKRFLGVQQACASCHADPHRGAMQFECATCHGQDTFAERAVPSHEQWLPLAGAHAHVDCRQCHAADSARALEQLRPGDREHARQCADCHTPPHGDAFLAGNARAAARSTKAVCATCHDLSLLRFTDLRVTVTPAQHAHGGFPLSAPHDAVVCASCHLPGTPWAERHPGREPDDCQSCHGDPHAGQFAAGPYATTGCVGCHARTHFEPHQFDRDHHARTALPLDGRHAELECKQCHADPAGEAPRRFRGTPSRCEQCHDDAHQGAFAHAAARLAAVPRGTCAQCHGTDAFSRLEHARFDHRDWTGFPIDGAHAQIECTDCHARAEQPDGFGRRFGRIERQGASFGGCPTCHGDPHDGVFDRERMPATIAGRTGCERCHDSASFRALPHGFDHAAFTGFALSGRHGELTCSACHPPLGTAAVTGRTQGKARGASCGDCHQDPHQRQFERLGRTDCAKCHKNTGAFATLSFRHNLDSIFPLGDQHAKVPCASCHKPEAIDGVKTVRYKPLATDCASCHGRVEGGSPFKRRRQ